MTPTTTLLTVEEFMQLPETDGPKAELIDGVVVAKEIANWVHELMKVRLNEVLTVYLAGTPHSKVFAEATFAVTARGVFVPDLAVGRMNEARPDAANKPPQGAPLLAIEIVSSESAGRLGHKIWQYLQFGSKAVWVVYPDDKFVVAHYPDKSARTFASGDTLIDRELPGFALEIDRLFEGLS
jgi:Uma2 family endonuclease